MNVLSLFNKSKNEIALRQDVDEILDRMDALTIGNDEQFQETGTFLKGIKGKEKEVKEYFEPERAKKYSEYKAVTDQIGTFTEPLGKAEKIVKRKIGDYRTAQEQKRREEEQKRLAELKVQEEDRLLEEAETNGDESILDDEIMLARPTLETEIPKMAGISFTEVWHFEIVDFGALVNAVAAGEAPLEVLEPAEKEIRQLIKALKGNTKLPGIRVYSDQQVGARSA